MPIGFDKNAMVNTKKQPAGLLQVVLVMVLKKCKIIQSSQK